MTDWCELPWPALDLIAKTLTFYLDYIRFRSVCRSWRFAAPRRPYLPLLAGHRFDGGGLLTVFDFFEFTGSEIFPVAGEHRLREISLGRLCCGCSCGWMAFIGPNLDVDLWNPLTKSHIELPTLAGYPDFDYSSGGGKHVLTYGDEHDFVVITASDFGLIKSYLAVKLVLSSDPSADPDCLVLLLHSRGKDVAVCKIGDGAWTPVRSRDLGPNLDAVFYKGRFHIASVQSLYALNVGEEMELERIPMSDPPLDEESEFPAIDECYLVESSGDLLLVNACDELDSFSGIGKDCSFEVYKVDWGMHRAKLLKLSSLGDCALFLGRSHSFSLPTSDLPGCKSNCFYLARSYDGDRDNICVYDIEDESNSMISICSAKSANPSSRWMPCAWITPSLLQ